MLVLYDPKHGDAPANQCIVPKTLDLLREGDWVWITYTSDLYIRAIVRYRTRSMPVLETKDSIYYIDEPDEEESIEGVFVTLSYPKDAISVPGLNWNKEGF